MISQDLTGIQSITFLGGPLNLQVAHKQYFDRFRFSKPVALMPLGVEYRLRIKTDDPSILYVYSGSEAQPDHVMIYEVEPFGEGKLFASFVEEQKMIGDLPDPYRF